MRNLLNLLTLEFKLDVIFSYNFKHIVKEKTRILTKIVNEERGYKGIVISSPREVF